MKLWSIIINTLSYADWIAPAAGIAEDIARGGDFGSHEFVFGLNEAMRAGWSPFTVVALLNKHGIETHGPLLPHGRNFRLKVSANQRDWAEYVLDRAGVPVVTPEEFNVWNLWGLL